MNEIPLVFGAERHLVGTLAMPSGTPAAAAFVLLNAGVVHRIGPHRINVKLARHLAAEGFASLRFDLSGQGDSRVSSASADFREQAVADIRAAMDHLERTADVRRFVIAGICSGADNGLAVAAADPRVVGLCMLDGYAYPTPKTRWVPWIKRRLAAARTSPGDPAADAGRAHPSREDYARTMQALSDRGVQVCAVFSGSMLPQYNYDGQFQEAFTGHGFATRVRSEYCPTIDHTVTPLAAQRQLVELVGDWARQLK
jgi:pimeloyl-ACP methyl ester carboxylesterase